MGQDAAAGDGMTEVWRQIALPDAGGRGDVCWRWQISRPAQLSRARKDLREHLAAGELSDTVDVDGRDRLLLVFEELASNGLRHGGTPIGVRVSGTRDGWLVDVCDSRPGAPPVVAVDRDPALGGLGLHLVARLAEQYGWQVAGTYKHVWARLRPRSGTGRPPEDTPPDRRRGGPRTRG